MYHTHVSKEKNLTPESQLPKRIEEYTENELTSITARNKPTDAGFWTSTSNNPNSSVWVDVLDPDKTEYIHSYDVVGSPNVLEVGSESKRNRVFEEFVYRDINVIDWRRIALNFDAIRVYDDGIPPMSEIEKPFGLWQLKSTLWFNVEYLRYNSTFKL